MVSRRARRYAVQLPVSFKGDHGEGVGTVLNLSPGGCAIAADPPEASGRYLRLEIQLTDLEDPVRISLAAVRWMSGTRFGVEFVRSPARDLERVKRFVKTLESAVPS